MKTVKDKKKFGYNKKPKNKSTRKGYQFDKEQRKQRRKFKIGRASCRERV